MKDDSTRKGSNHPARGRAHAPVDGVIHKENPAISGELMPVPVGERALSPEVGRPINRQFIRENGLEMTYEGDRGFIRDIDFARSVLGLAKPRNIRERIRAMLKKGDLRPDQVISIVDDEVEVFYLDNIASASLAFRSSKIDPEEIYRRMVATQQAFVVSEQRSSHISIEKALSGYDRVVSFLDRKDVSRAAKLAKMPLLEKYAHAAGIHLTDISDLLGPEQSRLEGV